MSPLESTLVTTLLLLAASAGAEAVPSDAEPDWGIPTDLAESLAKQADRYADYAVRFTSTETVRKASYDGSGEASDEKTKRYSYLLERGQGDEIFAEIRQPLRADGRPKDQEVVDEEPFPPAYAWVFLFGRAYQPYFAYRDRGVRFEGFDYVREIEFRGGLPFTDGKDIRQWRGTVLVDALKFTPVEIDAEPSGQAERIKWLFDRWARSFNLVGFKLAPRPFGYRCRVVFRLVQDRLSFPTELRYDTFRAVSTKATIPWRASTRTYEDYRFFRTETIEKLEGPKP